jgi:hypothetical protein
MKKPGERELREWEQCFIHRCKPPPLTPDQLISLWKKYGFDPDFIPILRKEILRMGHDEMTPEELRKLMEN